MVGIGKTLVAWAALALCLLLQAQAQSGSLAGDFLSLPEELIRTSSLDAEKGYIDPYADPLSIDPLMRPLDPHHTAEYLDIISGRENLSPYTVLSQELRGKWSLDISGGTPGRVDLTLFQNRDAVFGRGNLSTGGGIDHISACGWAAKDLLYLDLINDPDMVLYRCTLTMSKDFLSGSFNAYDATGQFWSGTLQGSRSTGELYSMQ